MVKKIFQEVLSLRLLNQVNGSCFDIEIDQKHFFIYKSVNEERGEFLFCFMECKKSRLYIIFVTDFCVVNKKVIRTNLFGGD